MASVTTKSRDRIAPITGTRREAAQVRRAECQLQHGADTSRIWVIGNLKNRMLRQLNTGHIRPNLSLPYSVISVLHTTR